ncbi:hypothetical protein [Photobacterium leiognathi]|uniref:hypothetical protein n=1 Tax=Photobacterium leiognathi TaxID=553611 RepID=UPI002736C57D|nr:hypothetical protein [Photobacterium leiognathi]
MKVQALAGTTVTAVCQRLVSVCLIGLSQGRNPITQTCPVVTISDTLKNPGKEYTRDGANLKLPKAKLTGNAGNNLYSHQQDTVVLMS